MDDLSALGQEGLACYLYCGGELVPSSEAGYGLCAECGTRWEVRFHGGDCSGTALARAQELGPDRVILRFAHPRSCGDPKGKLECSG
jgi:hypothetical protein